LRECKLHADPTSTRLPSQDRKGKTRLAEESPSSPKAARPTKKYHPTRDLDKALVEQRRRDQQCLWCGSGDHMVKSCPTLPRQGGSGGASGSGGHGKGSGKSGDRKSMGKGKGKGNA